MATPPDLECGVTPLGPPASYTKARRLLESCKPGLKSPYVLILLNSQFSQLSNEGGHFMRTQYSPLFMGNN